MNSYTKLVAYNKLPLEFHTNNSTQQNTLFVQHQHYICIIGEAIRNFRRQKKTHNLTYTTKNTQLQYNCPYGVTDMMCKWYIIINISRFLYIKWRQMWIFFVFLAEFNILALGTKAISIRSLILLIDWKNIIINQTKNSKHLSFDYVQIIKI